MRKKHARKAHAKKNHNYKNVKENKNMKNGRKMTEVENLIFTLQMQNELGDAEHMKNLVHEDLFDNLRALMENEGFDMNFMDDPDIQPCIVTLCSRTKELIEEGNYPMDEDTRKLAHKAFGMYLEDTTEDFINFINADHWQNRMTLFTGIYTVCLLEHYKDRNGWIEFLAKVAEAYEKERRKVAYERIANYLSLFVFDFPSIELSRNLASIVEASIKKMSA